MFPLNCALAVALMTAPADDKVETPANAEEFATRRPTWQVVAISWEILDAREVRYVLTRPEDFAALRKRLAKKWGPHRLNKTIQFIRCVFKYAYDAELLDRPIRFGPGFKLASKKVLRLHRAEAGPKLFSAEEGRRLIEADSVQVFSSETGLTGCQISSNPTARDTKPAVRCQRPIPCLIRLSIVFIRISCSCDPL